MTGIPPLPESSDSGKDPAPESRVPAAIFRPVSEAEQAGAQSAPASENWGKPVAPRTARQEYREAQAHKQTRVFSITIAFLVICLLAGVIGLIAPIPNLGFNTPEDYAETGQTPCPIEGSTISSVEGVAVTVLNGTSQTGLAASVGELLTDIGYTVVGTDNAPSLYRGNIQIEAGPTGITNAYTLAMYFSGATYEDVNIDVVLTDATTDALTVIIGDQYAGGPTADDIEAVAAYTGTLQAFESDCKTLNPDSVSGTQSGDDSSQSE